MSPQDLFGDIPYAVIGGVATRAYMPERTTKDVDFLISHESYERACELVKRAGWTRTKQLLFPNTGLGLYGSAWTDGAQEIDLIASDQPWAAEALTVDARDQTGLKVIALPYLTLMKLDSARGVDQGDLTRMLGTATNEDLERIVRIVARYSGDPHAADDVRQYAALGRMEWEQEGGEPFR